MPLALSDVIYRRNTDGNAVLLHRQNLTPCTRIEGVRGLYPVGSRRSVEHEHPEGIVLRVEDAERLGLRSDGVAWSAWPSLPPAPRDLCPSLASMILARQRYREYTEDPEDLSLSTVEEAADLVAYLLAHGLPFGVDAHREGATIMRGPYLSYTVHIPSPLPSGITLDMLLGAVRTGLMRRAYEAHADEAFAANDRKIAQWQAVQDRARDRFAMQQRNRVAHTVLILKAKGA
jgi:hypothetical protein